MDHLLLTNDMCLGIQKIMLKTRHVQRMFGIDKQMRLLSYNVLEIIVGKKNLGSREEWQQK